jgi:hypothetical protein
MVKGTEAAATSNFLTTSRRKVVDEVGPFSAHKLSLGCKQF